MSDFLPVLGLGAVAYLATRPASILESDTADYVESTEEITVKNGYTAPIVASPPPSTRKSSYHNIAKERAAAEEEQDQAEQDQANVDYYVESSENVTVKNGYVSEISEIFTPAIDVAARYRIFDEQEQMEREEQSLYGPAEPSYEEILFYEPRVR